jgi:hypothetical protein
MADDKTGSMIFSVLVEKEGDMWVAHCLELDIVTTARSGSSRGLEKVLGVRTETGGKDRGKVRLSEDEA